MSAHYGAPRLSRAELTTPAYAAGERAPRAHLPRRRAMMIAGATLGAPAVAAAVLALLGAAAGGDQPGLGSLNGTQGLQGSTVAAAAQPAKQEKAHKVPADDKAAVAKVRHEAPSKTASSGPVRRLPAPKPRPGSTGGAPPATDPNAPGAPVTSSSATSTTGSSTSGSGTSTTGSGSSGGGH